MSQIKPVAGPVSAAVRHYYEDLFDQQIDRFSQNGVPNELTTFFKEYKKSVIDVVITRHYPEGYLPFLLVLTTQCLGLYGLMRLIHIAGVIGIPERPTVLVRDVIRTSCTPYVVVGVEDGSVTLGKSGFEAERELGSLGLSPLSCSEAIALAAQNKSVLLHHGLHAMGSRYFEQGDTHVPSLQLESGRPILGYHFPDIALPTRGTPSCSERIFLIKDF